MLRIRNFILCFLLLLSLPVWAQQKDKTDIIVKLNGEELKGQVQAVEENAVKFVYSGETLQYTIKKEEISKIIFSSGRVEQFTTPPSVRTEPSPTAAAASVDHANKIAILPFAFVADGQQAGDEMGLKVQNECFALLNNHSGTNKIVDNHTTNALLIKAGVTAGNVAGYTMDELCNILGVAYVISGMVTVDKTTQTSYNTTVQNNSSTRKNDAPKTTGKSTSYGSSYSTSEQNYTTTLTLNIHNDKGESIFNQDRKAFWHQQDAYKSTLEYLIKRCPLYKK